MTLGSPSGQFRRPNNEAQLLLRRLELLLNLALNPLLIALRSSIKLCTFVGSCSFSISGNSKPGQDRSEWQAVLNRHGHE